MHFLFVKYFNAFFKYLMLEILYELPEEIYMFILVNIPKKAFFFSLLSKEGLPKSTDQAFYLAV